MPYFGNAPQFGDFPTAKLVGNGGTTYTLPFVLPNENTALVFLNGAPQVPGEHFSIIEDQLVFEGAVGAGVQIYVHGLGVGKALIAPSDGSTIATPDQFDASQKIANMAALQRALGNKRAWVPVASSVALGVGHVGSAVGYIGSSTYTVTLPATSLLIAGATISFYNNTNVDQIVAAAGAETIAFGATSFGGTVASTFTIPAGCTATFTFIGGTAWHVVDGTATLGGIASMYASKSGSGYQRLPSGLIIQWGTNAYPGSNLGVNITFPIAFPVACLSFVVTASVAADADGAIYNYRNLTQSGVRVNFGFGDAGIPLTGTWIAIGH